MISRQEYEQARLRAVGLFRKAGIVLSEKERQAIEVADFGLGDLKNIGLEVLVYVNTARVCAKELVLFPWQTCPEHRHPTKGAVAGKEETFRCRWGKVYLYVPGPAGSPKLQGLEPYREQLTAAREIELNPGDQYTLLPDTLHWFRGGSRGAVVSEFSTSSTDEQDLFTDPKIGRFTKIGE
jgi:D-lyxose ketol-isomerase